MTRSVTDDEGCELGACDVYTRAALVLCGASVMGLLGCMRGMDPAAAQAQFSSKNQSVHASANAAHTPLSATPPNATPSTHDPMPTTPVVLGAPTISNGASATSSAETQHTAATRADATTLLRAAAKSSWAALRAHAVEAAVGNPALLAELAPSALIDENRGVRFVACMAISEAPSKELADFVQPLLQDESDSVRAAATLALARCGSHPDPSPIAAMIYTNDAEVRANAYLVLGELGNRSAVPMIRDSLGHGLKLVNPIRVRLIDLAAAEALVKLGDEHEVEPIRAALFAPPEQSELTVVACEAIGRLNDEVSRPMLERLLNVQGESKRSPEIRLAAATAIVQLGGNPEIALLVANEYLTNSDPRIRAMCATLLRNAPTSAATAVLAALIRDSDPTVQVAAAAGLECAD